MKTIKIILSITTAFALSSCMSLFVNSTVTNTTNVSADGNTATHEPADVIQDTK